MSGHGGRACTNRNARSLAMLTKSECLRRGAAHKARAFRSGAGSPQGGGSVWGNIVITACLIALSARNSSDRLFLQLVSGSKASIFVRKTLQVFPCEIKKAFAFLSSQKRPAFFDEDDVCAGFRTSLQPACIMTSRKKNRPRLVIPYVRHDTWRTYPSDNSQDSPESCACRPLPADRLSPL